MYKIDTDDAVIDPPNPPVADTIKYFKNNIGVPPAWWLNMVQDEMSNVVTENFSLDKYDHTQLLDSINKIIEDKLVAGKMPYYNFTLYPQDNTTNITGTLPSMGHLRWMGSDFFSRGKIVFNMKLKVLKKTRVPIYFLDSANETVSITVKIMNLDTGSVDYLQTFTMGALISMFGSGDTVNMTVGNKQVEITVNKISLLQMCVCWIRKNEIEFVE